MRVKRCVQAKAKKIKPKKTRLFSRSSVAFYYQLNGNNALRVRVYIHADCTLVWAGLSDAILVLFYFSAD